MSAGHVYLSRRTSKQRQGLPQGAGQKRYIDVPSHTHTHTHTQAMVKNCHHQKSLRCGQQNTARRRAAAAERRKEQYCSSTTCTETTHMQENIPLSALQRHWTMKWGSRRGASCAAWRSGADLPFLGAFAKFPKAAIGFLMSVSVSVRPSVRMEELGCHSKDFHEYDIWVFFENRSRNFSFHYNLTRIAGTVNEDLCTVLIISHSFLLIIRNI